MASSSSDVSSDPAASPRRAAEVWCCLGVTAGLVGLGAALVHEAHRMGDVHTQIHALIVHSAGLLCYGFALLFGAGVIEMWHELTVQTKQASGVVESVTEPEKPATPNDTP
jgi:hypothetical protein